MKKLTLTILFSLVIWSIQATPNFTFIVNSFLCSDNIESMIDLVEDPVFIEHRQSMYNKKELIEGIKQAQKESGLYKLGKVCKGFSIVISEVETYDKGYSLRALSTDNGFDSKIYFNQERKIVGIYTQ